MTQGELAEILELIRHGSDHEQESALLAIVEEDLMVLQRIVELLPEDAISLLQSEPDKPVWEMPKVQLVEHKTMPAELLKSSSKQSSQCECLGRDPACALCGGGYASLPPDDGENMFRYRGGAYGNVPEDKDE